MSRYWNISPRVYNVSFNCKLLLIIICRMEPPFFDQFGISHWQPRRTMCTGFAYLTILVCIVVILGLFRRKYACIYIHIALCWMLYFIHTKLCSFILQKPSNRSGLPLYFLKALSTFLIHNCCNETMDITLPPCSQLHFPRSPNPTRFSTPL